MTMTLALRTAGVPDAVGPALRSSVTALDAEAAVFQMRPLSAYVDDALARSRAVTRVLAAFAAAALALVASGIFAVMSYDVARRRREIAVRMAVGATSRDVFAWVGTRALRVTGVGLATGMAAAAGASRLMTGLLFQVQPLDPVSYGAAAAGLALVAWLATYLPARRATRVDPVVALNDA
jgi:putative ABC transport system permease protein